MKQTLWTPFKDQFLSDFCQKQFWTEEHFLNPEQTKILINESHRIEDSNKLKPAKIGKGSIKQRNVEIRTDQIHWIDNYSTGPTQLIFDIFNELKDIAREELFLPIKRFECHFAKYDEGGFYKRHSDRHSLLPNRILSCVIYLSDMQSVDGGELVIYPPNQDPVTIQPTPGRIVVFDSELEHEVKTCTTQRRSLTGWLRSDLHPGLNL